MQFRVRRFVPPEDIEEAAQQALQRFGITGPPVDVECVLDQKLEMNLVPIPGLKARIHGDAFTARDWSAVFYDPDQVEERIRYSFAHELGHFLLHKEAIDGLPLTTTIDEWAELYLSLPQDAVTRAETQSNMFAANFMMPRAYMTERFGDALANVEPLRLEAIAAGLNRDAYLESVLDHVAVAMAPSFEVSIEAMTYRLRNLGMADRIS